MSARICVAALLAARALAAALALAPLSTSRSADLDLHRHWDQRCKDCHGHAADFARRFLRVENGRLAGAHHRDDLGLFLRNHYLTDELVPPVMAMLQAQARTPPLFSEKCLRCHGTAAEFARRSLVVKDGVLYGTPSGRRVSDVLKSHGGLQPAEATLIVETLLRVRNEVSEPAR